mgnify:CR=1 FL=1
MQSLAANTRTTIVPSLRHRDAPAAIDWLCNAYGFEVQEQIVDAGKLIHSQLKYGEGMIMVGDAGKGGRGELPYRPSPRSPGGATTQSMLVFGDHSEAHSQTDADRSATPTADATKTERGT